MTILMVDDDAGCLELWARMLHGLNARILFSQTIEEAFAMMAEIPPPDLVLLDLKIPPYTASETLAAVNAFRQYNPHLAVIVISGMRLDEIMKAIEVAGIVAQGALTKDESLSQARLLEVVKPALTKRTNYRDTMDCLTRVSDAFEKKRTKPLEP